MIQKLRIWTVDMGRKLPYSPFKQRFKNQVILIHPL
jgi:hypothetical protein